MVKRVPDLNEAFVVTFLTILNYMTGFLVSMSRNYTGEGFDDIYRFQGGIVGEANTNYSSQVDNK